MPDHSYAPLPTAPSPSHVENPIHSRHWYHRRRRVALLAVLVLAFAPAILLVLSLKTARVCVPLNLTHVSTRLHRAVTCSGHHAVAAAAQHQAAQPTTTFPISRPSVAATSASAFAATAAANATRPLTTAPAMSTGSRLTDWLVSQRDLFIGDLKDGRGKGWQLAMGNEAGDLDSIASAIGYAFLASALRGERVMALVMTPRKLMPLRPENKMALAAARIPEDVLLHVEDLPIKPAELIPAGVGIVCVDHNRLQPIFGADAASYNAVTAIVDHHEDERQSYGAKPRVIHVPTGSCSSLVAEEFEPEWKAALQGPAGLAGSPVPPELATLLLSAMMIDTQGLRPGGKMTVTDLESAKFLYPLSTLCPPAPEDTEHGILSAAAAASAQFALGVPQQLINFTDALVEAKFDVSNMTEYDLLLRDYKQYAWDTQSPLYPRLDVGLSTVPVPLETQLHHQNGWADYLDVADKYMVERQIDVLGVATTFKSKKGKGRRELFLSVRAGGALADMDAAEKVMDALVAGLTADIATFDLETWGGKDGYKAELAAEAPKLLLCGTRIAKVWNQKNHRSTRKQLAPAMHAIISTLK